MLRSGTVLVPLYIRSLFGLQIPKNACFRLIIGHFILSIICRKISDLYSSGMHLFTKRPDFFDVKNALWTYFWCMPASYPACLLLNKRSDGTPGFQNLIHWGDEFGCMHHNAREYGTRAFLVIWKKECLGFDWNFWRKKSLNDSNIICFLIFVQKIRKFRFPFLLSSDSFKWNILIFLHLLTEKNLKSHRILQFALLSRFRESM